MEAWPFSSTHYVKAAIDNFKKHLQEKKKTNLHMTFPKPRDAPIFSNYRPELDKSEEVNEVNAA